MFGKCFFVKKCWGFKGGYSGFSTVLLGFNGFHEVLWCFCRCGQGMGSERSGAWVAGFLWVKKG